MRNLKIDISKHKKRDSHKETDKHTTSINIKMNQWEYLKRNNLELSSLVRELLDRLIEEEKREVESL